MEEDPIDIEELEIILGLKNKKEELTKIINNSKKSLSFLDAVNEILKSEDSNQLCEKETDIGDNQENGMINEFIHKSGVQPIGNVKIQEYTDKNFLENIKTNDLILHNSKISYSKEYLSKLKIDFKEEVEKQAEPIEIVKQNKNENKKDKGNKKNKEGKNKIQNSENKINKNNTENKINADMGNGIDENDEDEIEDFEVIVNINNPDSDEENKNQGENYRTNNNKNYNNNYQNKKRYGNYGGYNKNQRRGNNNYGQDDDNNYKKNYYNNNKKNNYRKKNK